MHNLENAQPGKWHNGKCTTWKMAENTHPGKRQKIHAPENARPGKCTPWKLAEWKIHNLENPKESK